VKEAASAMFRRGIPKKARIENISFSTKII